MSTHPRWWQGHDGLGAQSLGTLTRQAPRPLPPTCPQGHVLAEVGGYRDVGPAPRVRCPACEAATDAHREAAKRERYRAWKLARRHQEPHTCPQGHRVDGDNLLLLGRRAFRRCRQCWETRAAATVERRAARQAERARRRAAVPRPMRPPGRPIADEARDLPGVGQWGLPVLRHPGARVLHWHWLVGWQPGLEERAWQTACRLVVLRRGKTSVDPQPPADQRCSLCVRQFARAKGGKTA